MIGSYRPKLINISEINKKRLFISLMFLPNKNAYLRKKVKQDAVRTTDWQEGVVKRYMRFTLIAIFSRFSLSSFLLDCELHFLYSALIDVGEDKGVVECFALLHRLLDMCHLAFSQYVLEEKASMFARHKAYLIGKR